MDIESKDEKAKEATAYPKSVFFIIGNEFCERFSYYGMRAVLTLYFKKVLEHSDDEATEAFHVFAMLAYFTPVLGAIIADSVLGKFRTIFYISILYAIGNIVLSYASWLEHEPLSIIGLVMIAFGTGGIKPCVSAFGGDQFGPGQERQLQQFFSIFYFAINAGSLLSTAITPIFREDVHCSSRNDCFPLAFGVPAVLMVVALVLFVIGKPLYNIIPAAKGNIVVKVVCCVSNALYRRVTSKSQDSKDHWLDYADDKYEPKLIKDVKVLMRVLFLYIPLPIFWALFDQQGSRWTLQATRMDGNLLGFYRVKPDQIQVINPVLIIAMIPVFEYMVYPALNKFNLLKKPLQRITVGCLLAAVSFVVAALVQVKIDYQEPTLPAPGYAQLTVSNGAPCPLGLTDPSNATFWIQEPIGPYALTVGDIDINLEKTVTFRSVHEKCAFKAPVDPVNFKPRLEDQKSSILFVTQSPSESQANKWSLHVSQFNHSKAKPQNGGADVKILYDLTQYPMHFNQSLHFLLKGTTNKLSYELGPKGEGSVGETKFVEVDPSQGSFEFSLSGSNSTKGTLHFEQGAAYILVFVYSDNETSLEVHTVVEPNEVSIFWQSFQYIIITAGEVMFSITGLEFSYSQAPVSMKSVLQAAWLLTVAFGNLIVVIIAKLHLFEKQSYEFLFFAALMALDMIVFAVMAYFYKNAEQEEPEEEAKDRMDSSGEQVEATTKTQSESLPTYQNAGYQEDTNF